MNTPSHFDQLLRAAAAQPAQAISEEVLIEKYAKGGERSIDDVRQRVARALAQVEDPAGRAHWEARFLQALRDGFVPAGRVNSAAGTELTATLINCFVQPVGDSIATDDEGHPGIYTEQPLPPYGCCCLGSIDLTRFVRDPFEPQARFDEEAFARQAQLAVRMLDNVLDVTFWPLVQQAQEARNKRRVGLGFTGLGDALIMLNLRYDTEPARATARRIAEVLRDAAYAASVELATERGAFPLFNPEPRHLRLAPALRAEGAYPRHRPVQLAPAVDRAHRHHQPGFIHRYAVLGVLDEDAYPLQEMGILQGPESPSTQAAPMAGAR